MLRHGFQLILLLLCSCNCSYSSASSSSSSSSSSSFDAAAAAGEVAGHRPVPVFVFGDSLVDAGNNNYLPRSVATARSLPYGIDFPTPDAGHPTGRFTNGLLMVDIFSQRFGGTTFPQPFLAPSTKGPIILNGVNYASSGSGILNNTGRLFIHVLPMDVQLSYFEQATLLDLKVLLGEDNVAPFLSKALFSVTIGANDLVDNYLSVVPISKEKFLPWETFKQDVLDKFKSQLKFLYNAGARKFIVTNMPKVGCMPYMRSLHVFNNGSCATLANSLAESYNVQFKKMLDELNHGLVGAKFLHADAYGLMAHIIDNYHTYGFDDVESACCGYGGSRKGFVPCKSFISPCNERYKYLFWDPYHLTQAGYNVVANEFIHGRDYISPMSIMQLLSL